jgi:starvation-inducible DNA-binding protein
MSRFLSLTGVLALATLAVADAPDSPGTKQQEGAIKLKAQNPAPIPSPHARLARTHAENNATTGQPGRVESSYPLKGDEERRKSIKGLQQLTVDLLALHNMYKEAHWDLTGPLFLPLHEYYQRQADLYLGQADLFAERVLQLGSSVDGRFTTIARTTKLAEMPEGYLTDDHSLKLLLDRVSVLQKEIYALIGETEDSDPPTSNKLQDLAHAVDKDLWQLRAHLQEPSSRRGDLPWSRRPHRELARSPLVKAPQEDGETNPDTKAMTRPIRLEKRPRKGRAFRLDSLHFDMRKGIAKAAWLESNGYETRMITADGKAIRPQIPTLPCAATEGDTRQERNQ